MACRKWEVGPKNTRRPVDSKNGGRWEIGPRNRWEMGRPGIEPHVIARTVGIV